MIITIVDVASPQKVKSYQVIEVTYKNDQGQVQGKKLMSFANPTVFKDIQNFNKGDQVDVETFKDDNGYWQWKSIKAAGQGGGGEVVQQTKPAATGGKVLGSNYETPEERAKRQVYIVRQSSISAAINILSVNPGKDKIQVEEVLQLAKTLEQYVFDEAKEDFSSGFDDFQDDIPL